MARETLVRSGGRMSMSSDGPAEEFPEGQRLDDVA
jgi:hypothetical protein